MKAAEKEGEAPWATKSGTTLVGGIFIFLRGPANAMSAYPLLIAISIL